jgi:HNH endonuclease
MNCPYCALRASDSDDHIFPQFLGGRATVPACNQCNSTFGHTIEASAFEHFKDWMFVFRRSGMAPPRPMIWRRVAIDDSGRRYDVDQDFNAVLTDPIITRDGDRQISRVEGSPQKLAKIAKSLQEKGAKFTEPKVSNITTDMRSLTLRYPLDQHLRRLALKMSIACVRRLGRDLRISDDVRLAMVRSSERYHRSTMQCLPNPSPLKIGGRGQMTRSRRCALSLLIFTAIRLPNPFQ